MIILKILSKSFVNFRKLNKFGKLKRKIKK
jgi:hypothetical protein